MLEAAGAVAQPGTGERWDRDRYKGPYLRDALLDAGVMVETLETVTFWSDCRGCTSGCRRPCANRWPRRGPTRSCSATSRTCTRSGASLYFTAVCAQLPDPVAQWRIAKAAASDAILAAGGSITHHHGVGTDHVRWYAEELGELGVRALAAVKRELDPKGVMNPGVLIATE